MSISNTSVWFALFLASLPGTCLLIVFFLCNLRIRWLQRQGHSLHAETPGEIIREILAPRRQGNGRISTTRSSQTASVSVETEHEASPTDDHPPSYEDVTKQYPSHEKPPRPPYPDDEDILPPPFSQAVAVSPLSSDVTPTHTTSSL